MVSDLASGCIVAWQDGRNGNVDLFAQQVDPNGFPGGPPPDPARPVITAVADVPHDQGGKVIVRWLPSSLDVAPYGIASYTLWRRSFTNSAASAVDGSRVRLLSINGTQSEYWEFIATVPANGAPGYAYMAPTGSDSLAGAIPWNVFFVQAKASASQTYYTSAVDSGYSVDNLSPAAPGQFAGNYGGGATHLHWSPNQETDLFGYRLYRGTSSGFVPGTGNLIATPADTGYADGAAGYYYKLSAVDVHGNESGFTLLSPQQTTDVGEGEAIAFALSMLSANPSRSEVVLRYALPRAGQARLAVHDVAGRTVRVLESGNRPAGEFTARWNGLDGSGRAVRAGMYFVRLDAGSSSATVRCVRLP